MPELPLLDLPWWGVALVVIAVGFVTSLAVSLYLHRSMTHGGVTFHPLAAIPMRAFLWLVTGMRTKEWVAVHRKHHAFSDREGDPHSPLKEGLLAIVLGNVIYYRRASKDREMLDKYGKGTPDDWLERRIFAVGTGNGAMLLLGLCLVTFGWPAGFLSWLGMVVWIPFWGGIINGVGHAVGYRNFNVKDVSRNIAPVGFIAGGEELHNNHHADPRSARFSAQPWEFDVGWLAIRVLAAVGLARVEYARTMPVDVFNAKHYRVPADAPADHFYGPEAGPELVRELATSGTSIGD